MVSGIYRWIVALGAVLLPLSALADTRVEDASKLFEQGVRYIDRGYYTLGVGALEEAVKANRNHFEATLLLADHIVIDERGVRYASEWRNQRARELYERAVALEPSSPHAHNNFAWLLVQTEQDPEVAVEQAEAALKLRPDQAEYLDTLAAAYCQVGRYREAREALGAAIELEPEASYLQRRKKKICRDEPAEFGATE